MLHLEHEGVQGLLDVGYIFPSWLKFEKENTESRTRTQCFDDFFQGNSKKLKQKWKRSGASWCGLHPSSWLNFEKKIVKILNLELDLVCFDNVFLLICENHNFKDLWSPNNYWHITHWKVQKVWKTIFIYFFYFFYNILTLTFFFSSSTMTWPVVV